jgi:hypothetical protein
MSLENIDDVMKILIAAGYPKLDYNRDGYIENVNNRQWVIDFFDDGSDEDAGLSFYSENTQVRIRFNTKTREIAGLNVYESIIGSELLSLSFWPGIESVFKLLTDITRMWENSLSTQVKS